MLVRDTVYLTYRIATQEHTRVRVYPEHMQLSLGFNIMIDAGCINYRGILRTQPAHETDKLPYKLSANGVYNANRRREASQMAGSLVCINHCRETKSIFLMATLILRSSWSWGKIYIKLRSRRVFDDDEDERVTQVLLSGVLSRSRGPQSETLVCDEQLLLSLGLAYLIMDGPCWLTTVDGDLYRLGEYFTVVFINYLSPW